jgi:hypothetical protein
MSRVIAMMAALLPAACVEVETTNPRPATQNEVQQSQDFAPLFPVCLSIAGIEQVSRTLTRDQMEGIAFVPQKDLPRGCQAVNIPAGYIIDIVGTLSDRDSAWRVPVGRLKIPEPEGSPFPPRAYGFALFPAQARLGGPHYRVNPDIRCGPLVQGMSERAVRRWHRLCG